jgi:tripartite-type tricarboxylate transporter receptor subunit TctC
MPLARRRVLQLAAAGSVTAALVHAAGAQAYPARPVRLVLGFPAGGATDLVARLLCAWLTERMGQSFVVENKPGAGTNLAVQSVVNAPPDGYTLLFATATSTVNASFYRSLPFNFLRDIAPVAAIADFPFVMEVNPSVPAATIAELIAYAKVDPGRVTMASFGVGTISHLALELFDVMAGVKLLHVPYRGGAPMVTDLIGGRVQAGIDALPNSLPHIQSGALRALAVLGATRSEALAAVPTVGETVPGYAVNGWTGIGAPSGTPAEIIATLNRAINAALEDPQVKARLTEVGARTMVVSPQEFGVLWRSDTEKWAKVVELAGIKPE